jgi:hypothetical protein
MMGAIGLLAQIFSLCMERVSINQIPFVIGDKYMFGITLCYGIYFFYIVPQQG